MALSLRMEFRIKAQ